MQHPNTTHTTLTVSPFRLFHAFTAGHLQQSQLKMIPLNLGAADSDQTVYMWWLRGSRIQRCAICLYLPAGDGDAWDVQTKQRLNCHISATLLKHVYCACSHRDGKNTASSISTNVNMNHNIFRLTAEDSFKIQSQIMFKLACAGWGKVIKYMGIFCFCFFKLKKCTELKILI